MEENTGIDLSNIQIDEEGLNKTLDVLDNASNLVEYQDASNRREEQQQQQLQQEQLAVDDPRNAEKWGFKGVAKEAESILSGGLQDTASSVATFPERTIDALSGEMKKERDEKGYYQPEWTPFTDEDNPIITKTWWGQLARSTVHFGTLALGTVLTAKALGVTAPVWLTGMAGWGLIRAAGIGAVSDLISKESDGHNALGMLRDRMGWMDTPLSTKDTDHPMMMKFKNIVEGMGIGLVFDGALTLLGKGTKPIRTRVLNRSKSIDDQTLAQGLYELRKNETEFRAAKNRPIADAEQGAYLSEDDPFVIWENQKKIRQNWGSEEGAAGNLTTNVQKERIAREGNIDAELVDNVLRKLLSNEKYQRVIEQTKGSRKRLVEVFGDAVAAHQRITQGRNPAELSSEDYLEELYKVFDVYDKGGPDEIATITSRNIVVADLVVGTLIQEIRDRGIAGRELADWVDLTSVDGPLEQIADTMLTALTEAKRARIVKSKNFAEIGAGKKRYLQETLKKEMVDTRESIISMLNLAKGEDGGELLMALFEAFSSMKTVNSLDDFDSWARKMIRGGEIEGKQQLGTIIRSLQGITIHSILSGPKTPMRAIMGTSTATFLRPFSTAIGAALRYPITGDGATLRASLSSVNAMVEAIPESFELFRNRLNSYWTGELSTVKTRFQEYTSDDQNWEIIRRWAEESGRATPGDVAMFRMANMARALNDNSFLGYSTKIMAATDDSFTYILGRAKMREKAMRSALDAQSKGVLTAYQEITPELLRRFEDDFYAEIFDGNGGIKDEAVKYGRKEVTLTKELKGFAGGLNQVFQANPFVRPFFYFARTGVNGLELTAKHTPGFNFLVKEFNDIAWAKPDDLSNVRQYGITTPEELANAKALQTGRLAMGSALVTMTSMAWMRGEITGNGPIDRTKRQMWKDGGYKTQRIKLGPVWVGYESIEPFNQIISMVADIGDASMLMGDEWTQDNLLKVALLLSQGVTSKSYLAGMQQFVDLVAGRPGQAGRVAASLLNNQVPLAGLRNELGKLFTPYTRELSSGIGDAIRNRNLISENLTNNPLPIKYDILSGKPIKDWDFLTRAYNAIIPIPLNLDYSPGRTLLFNSGYDLRMTTYYSPDGYNLTKSPYIRSLFQKAIGFQNLEVKLNRLAKSTKIIDSIMQMNKDINSGRRGDYNASDYWHVQQIKNLFDNARYAAWAEINDDPLIKQLIEEQDKAKLMRRRKLVASSGSTTILNMYK